MAIIVCVASAGCSHRSGPPQMSSAARAYLARALDLLQRNSIDAGAVDWPVLRAKAYEVAATAQTSTDTYEAIHRAVYLLHDAHTRFFTRTEANLAFDQATMSDGPPTGRILPGGYALLTVPAMSGNDQAVAAYMKGGVQAVHELDQDHPCGWVVDLRGNGGGNMWPMLTALAPLLIGPTLGYFVDASGKRSSWILRDGQLFVDGSPQLPQPDNYSLARPQPPVAILTDPLTASAAEATLIAFRGQANSRTFGQPTAGFPSANEAFALSDGAVLLITVANDADRTGHVYPNLVAIPPDQPVSHSKPGPSTPRGADPVIDAATQWLAGTPACR
ncbi:S41 family peptidase [Actinoplanes sp. SE50/110]|uniref:S41 family peptidase n=1 Tax=Actinoplanes sp. (strain ATCC 31044 / CBS 674.73 / SE50/110) TaxID=134676 RepID=UPI001E363F93|nr:S41 family peptidase [Actinoplanes sp. SE50/110]